MSNNQKHKGESNPNPVVEATRKLASTGASLTKYVLSDKGKLVDAGSRIVQSFFRGRFWLELGNVINELADKGDITLQLTGSPEYIDSVGIMLKFIDEKNPDSKQWEAVKKLFREFIIKEKNLQGSGVMEYQLIKTATELSSAQILIIIACKELSDAKIPSHNIWSDWSKHVANKSGLIIADLVLREKSKLTELGLLCGDTPGGQVDHADRFNLTEAGEKLAEIIMS